MTPGCPEPFDTRSTMSLAIQSIVTGTNALSVRNTSAIAIGPRALAVTKPTNVHTSDTVSTVTAHACRARSRRRGRASGLGTSVPLEIAAQHFVEPHVVGMK